MAYEGVSMGGMIDTVFGNWKPNQDKSALNATLDGIGSSMDYIKQPPQTKNKRVQNLIDNPGLSIGGALLGGYLKNSSAESDYSSDHGGMYPASPEELRAYQSLNARRGALLHQPEVEDGLNVSPSGVQSPESILGLGNTNPAQDRAQGDLNRSRDQAQSSKNQLTREISQGYTPPPDSKVDPVGYIAAINANKAKGVGGATGTFNVKAPDPLTQSQQQMVELSQQGKSAAFDMSKQPPWYKSNSFNYGLISFGLNLLSGNDLATSFAAAGGAFTDMYGQEQRGNWAEDLRNQGYSAQEVEEYIRTGDSKVLTDPQEKLAKQVQMQTNLQQLNNLQYEGSPEMRQYKLDRESKKDALSELQIRSTIANQNAQLGISQQRLALETQKQAAKEAASLDGPEWGLTNPEARMVLQQGKKFTDDSNLKRSRMAVAFEAAKNAKVLLAAGDLEGAAAAYDQYEESYGKAMQGGLGKINREDATDIAGPRDWFSQATNHVVRGYRGAPTAGEIDRAIASADRGIYTEHEVVAANIQSLYENLLPIVGAERAREGAKFQANGAGIGNWEPKATKSNVTFH